ncbi:MAG: hypothetical protein BJ554DRAFT_4236 [Olpidium bornovanus]|uniref:FHA domain-containing protein n=1 Tax=Olpidium bornovanus TaxID=278681 RepID=A0A8H7ZN10_9FUNG|nr:MAG: hypothetical protein BJ554DRAFT_4236 [Olpidium bornovanus]
MAGVDSQRNDQSSIGVSGLNARSKRCVQPMAPLSPFPSPRPASSARASFRKASRCIKRLTCWLESPNLPRSENDRPEIPTSSASRRSASLLKNFNPHAPPAPSIVLQPLNDSFAVKRLDLLEPLKIGRQVGAKSAPTGTNGYFDSKVLSRVHAEIWSDSGKDLKSSNGTFLNSQRLSSEGEESEPHELHSGDVVDFGIDILNEAGAILYKKVSSRVSIVDMELSLAQDASAVALGVLTGRDPAIAPPPVPEGFNEQTMRSLNIDALYGKLQTDIRKSKEAAADLEQAKLVLGKIPNQTAEVKDLEKKLVEATEKVNRVSNEYNQVQRALAEFKQTAAAERQKLIEEKNGFRTERDLVTGEISSLKTQIRQMTEEHEAEMKKLREEPKKTEKADRSKAAEWEEEEDVLKSKVAELSENLEKAHSQSKEGGQKAGKWKRQVAGARESATTAEDEKAVRAFQKKEAEWTAQLAEFEERLARIQEKNEELGVRNNALKSQITTLERARASHEDSAGIDKGAPAAGVSRTPKAKAGPGPRSEGIFGLIFGDRPLSLPVIGISVAVGAFGMWAFGLLSKPVAG